MRLKPFSQFGRLYEAQDTKENFREQFDNFFLNYFDSNKVKSSSVMLEGFRQSEGKSIKKSVSALQEPSTEVYKYRILITEYINTDKIFKILNTIENNVEFVIISHNIVQKYNSKKDATSSTELTIYFCLPEQEVSIISPALKEKLKPLTLKGQNGFSFYLGKTHRTRDIIKYYKSFALQPNWSDEPVEFYNKFMQYMQNNFSNPISSILSGLNSKMESFTVKNSNVIADNWLDLKELIETYINKNSCFYQISYQGAELLIKFHDWDYHNRINIDFILEVDTIKEKKLAKFSK